MMDDSNSTLDTTPMEKVTTHYFKIQRQYQQALDRWTPHVTQRWVAMAAFLVLFFLRIVFLEGVSMVFFSSWFCF